MSCLLSNPKANTCETPKKVGGIRGGLWLLNLEDSNGVPLAYTESGNVISDITVQSGLAAYKVDGEKYAHNWTYAFSKPAINKFYTQTLNVKTIIDGEADLTWLDEMLMATNLVAIIETNDQQFIVLGQKNGLTSIEGDLFDSGNAQDADVSTTAPLQGEEVEAPYKYLSTGGYDSTKTYIIGLETPAA
tara:strand:+ start:898 stop:1464 length:567 start_codon:yes stop_codon:yes gene_type:complete